MHRFANFFFAARAVVALSVWWGLLGGVTAVAITNEPLANRGFIFRAWLTEDGLPQNTVNNIVRTRDGYLWLGTQGGLARFDGVRFKLFGLAEGLPNVQVRVLYEDTRRELWIGTQAGLSRMRNDRIEIITAPDGPAGDNITAITEDANGQLWVGTTERLYIWQEGKVIRPKVLAELGAVRALLSDRHGTVWIATPRGLFKFQGGRLIESVGPESDRNITSVYCMLEDKAGNLWVSVGNGKVLCWQNEVWRVYDQSSGLPFAYVTSLAEDAEGKLWAGSLDSGLYYFDGGRFNQLTTEAGLSSQAIRSLLSDREGNFWVGHRTEGLNRMTSKKLVTLGAGYGLTHDYVRSVAQAADGQLWLGTTGGGIYREQDGVLLLFTNVPFNSAYPFVETVLAARDGSVWWGGAASLFRWKDGSVAEAYTRGQIPSVPDATVPGWMMNASVTALMEDLAGGLWVGTSLGEVVQLSDGRSRVLTNRLGSGAITSFAQEPDGTLWVGSTSGGLCRLRDGRVTTFSKADGLACDHVRVLHLTDAGTLWIGTGGGGLLRWKNGEFKVIGVRHGLGDDTVSQILEDDEQFLWLGCNRGIFRVARAELDALADGQRAFVHPQIFGVNAGMAAEECTGGSTPTACKLRDGRLCFPTVKGIVLIDPQLQETESSPPPVLLEEVWADRALVPLHRVANAALGEPQFEVTIPAGRRECEFHYTGLSFGAPERLRFRFQLVGVDDDWIEANTRRVAYYNPLRPGKYEFRVKACNANGVWSPLTAQLTVTALPYFWETRWFRLTVAVTLGGLLVVSVFSVARRRYKRRLAGLELQNAVARERLRISQDMHDAVGGILTRVSILSDVAQSEGPGGSAPKQFARIGEQVRAAVVALDEIVWATNPQADNLPRFIEYVGRYADEYFENTGVRCWQEIAPDLPQLPFRADVRHNVFLAAKEALHNVLKHSGASEVWVRLKLDDATICLEIEDNGRGFAPEVVPPGGNGLGNIRSRLTECGGRAEITSVPGPGVKIQLVLTLPRRI